MKRVEASTLEEAYVKAATKLACSISNLEYEVIQYPSNGILGFMKKKAIIVATCKEVKKENIPSPKPKSSVTKEESLAIEVVKSVKEESVINEKIEIELEVKKEEIVLHKEKNSVLDNFFDTRIEEDKEIIEELEEEVVIYDELAMMIENQLKELLSHSCFDIDIVEVDVRDNTALIFIDGEDAALLIGKEGYRYNALSYMLFNWLHTKYELFIKLEIAEFLTSQQEMIRNYIKPVIDNVEKNGRGKTRPLDGILVQIALEQLRENFPNKYVAVKTSRDGKKFVVINEFNNKAK
ncbi:MAG: Jag N-terminal domain-containing protein [Campylobacterota bacterium]|nr:Jag N-terminal domain-containing protein [Campylobacterota bacterium]